MMKLRFDLNKHLAEKPEDQKVTLPVEMELNEQELATVAGGWCGYGCCWGCCGGGGGWRWRHHRHHFRHHRHW